MLDNLPNSEVQMVDYNASVKTIGSSAFSRGRGIGSDSEEGR